MNRHEQGCDKKSTTVGAGSWVRGLTALGLALVAAGSTGCPADRCRDRCATAFTGRTQFMPAPPAPSPIITGSVTGPTRTTEDDEDDPWHTDFVVARLGSAVKWLGRRDYPEGSTPPAFGGVSYSVPKSTRVADGRVVFELFDDRVKTAEPVALEEEWLFDVTRDVPVRIEPDAFEALGGKRPQPLFKNAAEFGAVGRYLACAGLTMDVKASTTELSVTLRNTSDLAQFVDAGSIVDGGTLTLAAYGDDTLLASAPVTGKTNFKAWEGKSVGNVTVPGTPEALAKYTTLYVGYALGQKFHGCALPAASIKDLLVSRSHLDDYTTFAFNRLLGADPAVVGNWCWTKHREIPKWAEADPTVWGNDMFEH